jgi:hypothetical protein
MVVLILARELWITGLRAFAANDGTVVSAKSGGKVKSALQMVSILALLLHEYSFSVLGFRIPMQFVGLNLLIVSLVFSYLSAVDYSLAIFAPDRGSLADITKQVGEVLLATPTEPAGSNSPSVGDGIAEEGSGPVPVADAAPTSDSTSTTDKE